MRDHVKILGVLNIIMGGLTALRGVIALIFLGGIASVIALNLQDLSADELEHARLGAPIMGLIGLCVGAFLLLLSLPAIIGGWGLIRYKSWSRVWMIILSALHLFHVPFGTALGVYGLWVLLNEQTRQLLESGGALPPPLSYPMPQPGFRTQA